MSARAPFALDVQSHSPRFVCAASIPLLDTDDAVAEIKRASNAGFRCGFLPTRTVIGFHIGHTQKTLHELFDGVDEARHPPRAWWAARICSRGRRLWRS